jgi:hypothetical protein
VSIAPQKHKLLINDPTIDRAGVEVLKKENEAPQPSL